MRMGYSHGRSLFVASSFSPGSSSSGTRARICKYTSPVIHTFHVDIGPFLEIQSQRSSIPGP